MALFGSRKGLKWWGELSDAENEVSLQKECIEPIKEVIEGLEKIRYMYDDPIYRKNINNSIKILESYMNKLKKDIKSSEEHLNYIKENYYD